MKEMWCGGEMMLLVLISPSKLPHIFQWLVKVFRALSLACRGKSLQGDKRERKREKYLVEYKRKRLKISSVLFPRRGYAAIPG